MDSQAIRPQTVEERIVWYALRYTYLLYAIGALYLLAPAIAWILLAIAGWRYVSLGRLHPLLPRHCLPLGIWIWVLGMFCMLVILWVGHLDFNLGVAKTIKSTIGWAKGWALLAIFPLIGCCQIRPAVIIRASMHVCLQTLVLLPVFIAAWLIGLPETLYISPLQAVGGPGPEFFALNLYEIDPGSGWPRWRMFTPWAPALGFVANLWFLFAMKEKDWRWKVIGITATIIMILMSGSRLAIVALVLVYPLSIAVEKIKHPAVPFGLGFMSTIIGVAAIPLYNAAAYAIETFRAARAGSSRVRSALARIAVDRSLNESPIWGHGIVERGPHLVEFMPIGSHHTWLGLLFVKGILGIIALAIPMLFTLAKFIFVSEPPVTRQLGFAILVLLGFYSLGENLEMLAYLIWPGLIYIGIVFRDIEIHAHKSKTEECKYAAS